MAHFSTLLNGAARKKALLRSRPNIHASPRLRFEQLEERCMLATVTWDGGGGNFDWNNDANWDGDKVPGAEDIAVIDLNETFTINLTTNVTIAGLTLGGNSGSQTLNLDTSRKLTINGPATITPHGVLILNESNSIEGTGTLSNQGTMEVQQSATISLSFENTTAGSILRFGDRSCCGDGFLQFSQG